MTRMLHIEEFCKTGSGGTPSRKNADVYFGGQVPWVKSGELRENIIMSTEESITEAALRESSAKIIPSGALLVAMYGATVGRVGILGIDAASNQAVCHIVPNKDIADTRYLFHMFRIQAPVWVSQGVGGAQPNITQNIIRKTAIPLPPLPEQKRIAAILDKADAIKRKRQESIRLLDDFRRATFLDMFGDPVTNPKGWPVTVGDEILFLTSGSRGWAKYYAESGDVFVRIQNLKSGRLDLSDIAYVNAPASAESQRTLLYPGDVLLSITADLGRTAVVPTGIGKAHINQHLAILRFKNMNPVFVSHQIASDGGQVQFGRLNKEGVKAGLNFNDIKSILLTNPPLDLQRQFAAIVQTVEQQKATLQRHATESESLSASLQSRAFKGVL